MADFAVCYKIYCIHSLNKGGGRWPPPQKRWRGLRPRHLFRGFLCLGCDCSKYCSSQGSRQGNSLGFPGTCRQQNQSEIRSFFSVNAARERKKTVPENFKKPTATHTPIHVLRLIDHVLRPIGHVQRLIVQHTLRVSCSSCQP